MVSNVDNQYVRKTVSFANNANTITSNNTQRQTYNNYNRNFNSNNLYGQRASLISKNGTTTQNFTQSSGFDVRPSIVSTSYNQALGNSQIFFANPSMSMLGRNPSVVVKPDSLIKIEIYSPELNGSLNRHYSARLACFIKSLNTLRGRDNSFLENSFVNGGVWAKPFQNRNSITIVLNGTHIVETFPMTIFNEDPNWNYHHEIKEYRRTFIKTISQFSDCDFLDKLM